MTMNTKEMYLIVNEDNFSEIINEKTKEGKIKLFLDIVEEKEENLIEPLEEMLGGINKNNENIDDFNDKLSLSGSNELNLINNEVDKKNSQKENKISLENKNNNENDINNEIINNNIISDNKKELPLNSNSNEYNKNENIKILISPQTSTKLKNNNDIDLDNIINNNVIENKSEINKEKENIIFNNNNKNNNQINSINIIENNNKNNNLIEIVEICTNCKKLIKDKIKYECCLCDKCVLCQICEKAHDHPCIKFKLGETILTNLIDCHSFISQKQKFSGVLPIKYIKSIFNNTFDIILQLGIDSHIEIRPNKSFEIPVLIKNYSESPITSNEFILIIKNYSIVNITYPQSPLYK